MVDENIAIVIGWHAAGRLMKAVFDKSGQQMSQYQASECSLENVLAACGDATVFEWRGEPMSRKRFETLARASKDMEG